jgi:hypothetical protein
LPGIGIEKLAEEINPSEGKQIVQVKSPKLESGHGSRSLAKASGQNASNFCHDNGRFIPWLILIFPAVWLLAKV